MISDANHQESSKPSFLSLPLVLTGIAAAAMAVIHFLFPLVLIIKAPWYHLGWIFVGLAVLFTLAAGQGFRRAGTTVMPYREADAMVTTGVYNVSRNPMYVAFVAGLSGVAMLLGSFSPWLVIPIFVWFINRRVIAAEEAMMETKFGAEYGAYKARVRRWI